MENKLLFCNSKDINTISNNNDHTNNADNTTINNRNGSSNINHHHNENKHIKKKSKRSSSPSNLNSSKHKSLSLSTVTTTPPSSISKAKASKSKPKSKKSFTATSLTLDKIYDFLESNLPPTSYHNASSVPNEIKKYYNRRKQLFSKFHLGIRLDYEGWFSVTPEGIAKHTAEKCRCDVLVDLFAGVGGNTIQFAATCKKVIAVEHDATRLACTLHNAGIYKVQSFIHPILMDAFEFLETTKDRPDVIFLSPPWGGPEYLLKDQFYFHMLPIDWPRLLSLTLALTPNLVMYLPRNLALSEIQALAKQLPDVLVEQVFTCGRPRALLIYTGDLAKSIDSPLATSKYLDFSSCST